MEQNMEPIRVSKGSMSKSNDKIIIKWRENKKEKSKNFHFCKYKRTDEETLKLAEEFLKTIQEKHKLWKGYNKEIQDEKRQARNKQYNIDNIDKIKARNKQYNIDNIDKIKEKQKEYRQNNADKIKEKKKEYYKNNIDKINQYREKNADKIKEQTEQYRIKRIAEHIKYLKTQSISI